MIRSTVLPQDNQLYISRHSWFMLFIAVLTAMLFASVSLAQNDDASKTRPNEATAALLEGSGASSQKANRKTETQFDTAIAKAEELMASPDLPAGTKTVSLKEALRLTHERNLSLKQIRMELEKADAKLWQARGYLMPIVQAEAQYVMADHNVEVNFGGGSMEISPKHTASGSLTASMPLVNVGIWKSVRLAKRGTDMASLSIREARRSVLYGTAQAYYSALLSRTLVTLYKDQITATQAHLRVAEQKFLAGSGLRIDVLRAGIDFEQAEEDLLNARLSLASACDALGVLAGVDGMLSPQTVAVLPAMNAEVTDETMVNDASRERLDMQMAQLKAQLAADQMDSVVASLFPSLNLTWQGTLQITEPTGLGADDRTRWNLILGLTIPLFNYNTYATIRENKAARKQAELDIDVLARDIGQEVRLAHREYQTALTNVKGAARRVKLASESLELAEAAYTAGAGTSLDITDARRMYLQAEVNLATTELKTQLSLLQLLKSIGKNPSTLTE
ncbi:MAG: TolC family protein [Deltaproteobacteria bacterium]|nr:TolC family protein [Deltaproteobacteria bacterium]